MQFAVQDLRKWGYKKILLNFGCNKNSLDNFFKYLYNSSTNYYDTKCSAFSLPKKYKYLVESENCNLDYTGMFAFIKYCEPMIDVVDCTVAIQRKFRNQWGTLWKGVGRDLGLSEQDISMLQDLGLKIFFADSFSCDAYLLSFFNSILMWFVITSSESNLGILDKTPLELIEYLITSDSDEFLADIASCGLGEN